MRKILVDVVKNTGWTSDGIELTSEQVGRIVRASNANKVRLVPTVKANVREVRHNGLSS